MDQKGGCNKENLNSVVSQSQNYRGNALHGRQSQKWAQSPYIIKKKVVNMTSVKKPRHHPLFMPDNALQERISGAAPNEVGEGEGDILGLNTRIPELKIANRSILEPLSNPPFDNNLNMSEVRGCGVAGPRGVLGGKHDDDGVFMSPEKSNNLTFDKTNTTVKKSS